MQIESSYRCAYLIHFLFHHDYFPFAFVSATNFFPFAFEVQLHLMIADDLLLFHSVTDVAPSVGGDGGGSGGGGRQGGREGGAEVRMD